MIDEFTVASTTDSLEDVQAAAGVEPDKEGNEEPAETPSETPEAPESEPVSDTDTEEAEAPKPKAKGKNWFDKRIDRLSREKFEAIAERDSFKERLEKLESQLQAKQPQPAAPPVTPEGRPLRQSFRSDEDYVEAVSEWKAKQVVAAMQRQEHETAIQNRDREVHASYLQMADEYTESHPDFNQVVGAIRVSEDIAPGVQVAIMGRPNAPEVAYYLGTHPEVCEQISQMNPADAVAEIGAISASLVKSAPKTTVLRTPGTIKPVAGGSTRVARDPAEMEYDEYRLYRGDGRAGTGLAARRRR